MYTPFYEETKLLKLKEANLKGEITSLINKYNKMDYWDLEQSIQHKIAYVKDINMTDKYPESLIRKTMTDNHNKDTLKWLMGAKDKILSKDLSWLKSTIRYDQKVMMELFQIVTGINLKGKTNKDLLPIFTSYVKDDLKEGMGYSMPSGAKKFVDAV